MEPDRPNTPVELASSSGLTGRFYYTARAATPPPWVTFIDEVIGNRPAQLVSSSASGLLVLENEERFFALTFGYGRSLLNMAKVQQGFGLKVALNRIDPRQLRSLDTRTFEDIVVSTTTQSSKSAQLPTFDVDVSRDILRAATGEPNDDRLGKRLSGSDAVVLNIEVDAHELPRVLTELATAYEETTYKSDFGWIDDLTQVRDKQLTAQLDHLLVDQLKSKDVTSSHLAMPDVVDWEDVDAFRITGTRETVYEDLDLAAYLESLATTSDLTVEKLRSRAVSVRFTRSPQDWAKGWSFYNCIVSEQRLANELYVLINGTWFAVAQNLVDQVDRFTNAIPASPLTIPPSQVGQTEGEYNAAFAGSRPISCFLMRRSDDPEGRRAGSRCAMCCHATAGSST